MAKITANGSIYYIQLKNSVLIYSFPSNHRLEDKKRYFRKLILEDKSNIIEDELFQTLQDKLEEYGITPANSFLLDGEYSFDGQYGYYASCSQPGCYKAINFQINYTVSGPAAGIADIDYDWFDVEQGKLRRISFYGTFDKKTNIITVNYGMSQYSFVISDFDSVINILSLNRSSMARHILPDNLLETTKI